jgi:hypothetical protein
VARKIAVISSASAAGKTTLAAELSRRLGVPHVELDALHHGPDWAAPSAEEFKATVAAALEPLTGWVVDGNYQGKLGTFVLGQADTIARRRALEREQGGLAQRAARLERALPVYRALALPSQGPVAEAARRPAGRASALGRGNQALAGDAACSAGMTSRP